MGEWFVGVTALMGMPRYAARRDASESQMRGELADAGWLTQPLSMKDWPDLICAKGGRLILCESKSDRRVRRNKGDGVSDNQREVHRLLLLFGVRVIVAETAEQFLRAVGDLH